VTRRRAGALAAMVAAAVAAFAIAPAAEARDASAAQVRALAARAAQGDGAALALLRGVDAVDGRRVALRAALRGADGPALRARLRVLARAADTGDAAPAGARGRARAILAEGRFHRRLPQPLKRPLERLGDWLNGLWNGLPGGPGVRWVYAIVAVALIAAIVSVRGIRRRRGAPAPPDARPGARPAPEGPAALERRADEAERAGDHALAVRLRFRAGLQRLGEREAIPYRPSLTTAEARRRLRSERFDRLAADFDAIAYGGRAAAEEDARAARSGWREVLAGVASR
jgi:Domain of unknown function (DUF4129)